MVVISLKLKGLLVDNQQLSFFFFFNLFFSGFSLYSFLNSSVKIGMIRSKSALRGGKKRKFLEFSPFSLLPGKKRCH